MVKSWVVFDTDSVVDFELKPDWMKKKDSLSLGFQVMGFHPLLFKYG